MNAIPPSAEIKDLLAAQGLGVFAEDIFVGKQPVSPDQCITVIDSGGFTPESGYTLDNPTVQILVRGAKDAYVSAWNKAQQIKVYLHNYSEASPQSDNSRIIGIWAMGDILFIEWDESNRPVFSINFRIQRTG